jgi:hypothetical protein
VFLCLTVVWFTPLRARAFDAAAFEGFAGEAATLRGFL